MVGAEFDRAHMRVVGLVTQIYERWIGRYVEIGVDPCALDAPVPDIAVDICREKIRRRREGDQPQSHRDRDDQDDEDAPVRRREAGLQHDPGAGRIDDALRIGGRNEEVEIIGPLAVARHERQGDEHRPAEAEHRQVRSLLVIGQRRQPPGGARLGWENGSSMRLRKNTRRSHDASRRWWTARVRTLQINGAGRGRATLECMRARTVPKASRHYTSHICASRCGYLRSYHQIR